jgi:dTDP-4-amino-4,6-dideoxygalactose transaminase
MTKNVPLFKVFMSSNVGEEVTKTLLSGFVTQGPKVDEFEHKLCTKLEHPYVLTLNSATSGLTLALRLLQNDNIETGWPGINKETDIVLTTPLTCTATNWPILANGMKLQWVDVDKMTCGMSLDDLEKKITKYTKVIYVVHWGGSPIDLDKLDEILERKRIEIGFKPCVIEDCAHAFMSKYDGKYLGSHNNICVYSLQAIKHLTTGDGGLITLPDRDLYERAKLLRWYGIDRDKRNFSKKDFRLENDVVEWGYKFHMNDINATIGLCNIEHIDDLIMIHKKNAHRYNTELQELNKIKLLNLSNKSDSSYWIYTMFVDDVENFINFMKNKGVVCSQVHKRNDFHSCVSEFVCQLPNLDEIEGHYVCIPVGWWLNDEDVTHVITSVKEYDNLLSS